MQRNQTWGPGGAEAGPPISDLLVPLSLEEQEKTDRRKRLQAAQPGLMAMPELQQLMLDILLETGLQR